MLKKRNISKSHITDTQTDQSDTDTQTVSIERVVTIQRTHSQSSIMNHLPPIPTNPIDPNEDEDFNISNLRPPLTIYRKKNSHNITRNRNKRHKYKKHKKTKTKTRKQSYNIDLDDSSGFNGPKRYNGDSPLPKPPPRKQSINSVSSMSRTSSTLSTTSNITITSPQTTQFKFTAAQPPINNVYVFENNGVYDFVHSRGLGTSL